MGTSRIFLRSLFLCGALGLASSPNPGRLCYTCGFIKPCYAAVTKCQDDEACGISTGTSDQNEIIQRKGCLPRAQCSLPGRTTYRERNYALQHQCCEQDLCNAATMLQGPPSPLLTTLSPLLTSWIWGGYLLH